MSHFVYKYVLDGEVLYVGKTDTNSIYTRLMQHGRPGDNITSDAWDEINKADVYYTELANATMSDVVESELINRYKPKYNIAKTHLAWSGLPFPEPVWVDAQMPKIRELMGQVEKAREKNHALKTQVEDLRDEIRDLQAELYEREYGFIGGAEECSTCVYKERLAQMMKYLEQVNSNAGSSKTDKQLEG